MNHLILEISKSTDITKWLLFESLTGHKFMKQNYVKCNKVGTTLDTPTLETKRYKYNAVENRT